MSRDYQIGKQLIMAIDPEHWDRYHAINQSQVESLFGITINMGGMVVCGRIVRLEDRPNIVVQITSVEPPS